MLGESEENCSGAASVLILYVPHQYYQSGPTMRGFLHLFPIFHLIRSPQHASGFMMTCFRPDNLVSTRMPAASSQFGGNPKDTERLIGRCGKSILQVLKSPKRYSSKELLTMVLAQFFAFREVSKSCQYCVKYTHAISICDTCHLYYKKNVDRA